MENKIKELRVSLDGITQLIRSLKPYGGDSVLSNRELALTRTSLESSKMWLGKVLKELGTANPYPESKNPANEKIEPTADTNDKLSWVEDEWTKKVLPQTDLTHIQKVKYLRAEIEKIENELKNLDKDLILRTNTYNNSWMEEYLKSSITYCIEAGMWLGMELGRIRDNENK